MSHQQRHRRRQQQRFLLACSKIILGLIAVPLAVTYVHLAAVLDHNGLLFIRIVASNDDYHHGLLQSPIRGTTTATASTQPNHSINTTKPFVMTGIFQKVQQRPQEFTNVDYFRKRWSFHDTTTSTTSSAIQSSQIPSWPSIAQWSTMLHSIIQKSSFFSFSSTQQSSRQVIGLMQDRTTLTWTLIVTDDDSSSISTTRSSSDASLLYFPLQSFASASATATTSTHSQQERDSDTTATSSTYSSLTNGADRSSLVHSPGWASSWFGTTTTLAIAPVAQTTLQTHISSTSSRSSSSSPTTIATTDSPTLTIVSFGSSSLPKSSTFRDSTTTITGTDKNSYYGSSKFSFRRNPNKQHSSKIGTGIRKLVSFVQFHPTTTLWLLINVGLWWWYWNCHVSSNLVSVNPYQILVHGDYGRAITGTLAHFELWHVGINMMTWSHLGPPLEQHSFGSIPIWLYTWSLIAITTLVLVVLDTRLQLLVQKFQHFLSQLTRTRTDTNNSNNSSSGSSSNVNIVGFSGILFAWMVIEALQHSDNPNFRICPIPTVFPEWCFPTHEFYAPLWMTRFWNASKPPVLFSINFGPLVQLIATQLILPRASFTGHLTGIIAGFGLHTLLLLSSVLVAGGTSSNTGSLASLVVLEWLQPVIIFPIVWMYGKLYRQENILWSHSIAEFFPSKFENENGENIDGSVFRNLTPHKWLQHLLQQFVMWIRPYGTMLRNIVHRPRNEDTTTRSSSIDNNGEFEEQGSIEKEQQLQLQQQQAPQRRTRLEEWMSTTQDSMIVFWWIEVLCLRGHFCSSMVIAHLMMVWILHILVNLIRIRNQQDDTTTTLAKTVSRSSKSLEYPSNSRQVGIVGRGLIFLIMIVIITDSMTLGGWLLTRALWQTTALQSWGRIIFLGMYTMIHCFVLCLVSTELRESNEQMGKPSSFLTLPSTGAAPSSPTTETTTKSVFGHVFGWSILEPGHLIASTLLSSSNKSTACWNVEGDVGDHRRY